MEHTHIKTIDTSRSYNDYNRKDKNRIDPIYSWMLLQPHPTNFTEGKKKPKNLFTWPGLKNQHLFKHLPPIIVTAWGHMYQERKTFQSTKQVTLEL